MSSILFSINLICLNLINRLKVYWNYSAINFLIVFDNIFKTFIDVVK